MMFPAVSTSGKAIDLESCSVEHTYTAGKLTSSIYTAASGDKFKKTFTYTGGGLPATESAFVDYTAPSGGYTAKAVHSDGTPQLTCGTPFAADSDKFIYSQWIRCNADQVALGNEWFVSYPHGYWAVYFSSNGIPPAIKFEIDTIDSGAYMSTATNIADGNWHHVLGSVDLATQTFQFLIDGANALLEGVAPVSQIKFHTDETGIVYLGDGYGDNLVGDHSDVQLYIGQTLDFTVPANLALFIAAGKPVDPAVAIASLGTPDVIFSGDHTTFPVNQGTGGAFTLTGTLTDASSSPSD